MANNFLSGGLLGMGGMGGINAQPTSLLGEFYDPKMARNAQIKNMLLGMGVGLMSQKGVGRGAELALTMGNQAQDDYRRQAFDAYRMKQAEDERAYGRERDAKADERWQMQYDYNAGRAQKDDAWNNTQRQRQLEQWQQEDDQRAAADTAWGNFRNMPTTGVPVQNYGMADQLWDMGKQDEALGMVMPKSNKGNWTSVGKDSVLFNEDTQQFMTPPTPQGGGRVIDDPMKIGKDYQNQPGFTRLKEVAPTIESMVKSLEDPSAMADLDFVYGLAKILDPTSVVRESEAGMVIDSQGIAPSLLGQLNKILTGEQAMLPETRRKLVSVAIRRAKEFETQAQQERGFYGNMAQENNFNPDTYLQPVPAIPGVPNVPRSNIPQEAISELMSDPSPEAVREFDEAFGPGAAAAILGGR